MTVLLLPLAQTDALAQQQGYPQYPNNQYIQPSPNYSQPQPYGQQQQPYPQAPNQYQGQYADPGQNSAPYPDQYADQDQAYAPQPPYPQQQPQQPFAPDQLEQLVAPIALYPDTLVAQILAAATYPAQVVAADHWIQSQGYASPDQIAFAADAQPTWDPSVKALTAFPQVLGMMDRDLQWTTDLGNAYYNQPQDVLQTIQVLRQRAQSAGTLQNTQQEQVYDNQGYIQLAPTNPQFVYVPTYNPWYAYGAPIAPYPGFSLVSAFGAIGAVLGPGLRFGAGIALAAFAHTSFGWLGWGLNWLTSSILFHQAPYYSRSTSVAHFANYGGRGGHFPSRPQPEGREAYARSGGYDRNGYAAQNYVRPNNGYSDRNSVHPNSYGAQNYARQPERAPQNYAYNRPTAPAYGNNYARPSAPYAYNYNRPQPQPAMPSRGYSQYPNPRQTWRPAEPAPQRSFTEHSYDNRPYAQQNRSYSAYSAPRSFAEPSRNFERSGGSRVFSSSRGESFHTPKAPKPPKSSGGGLFHHNSGGKHR